MQHLNKQHQAGISKRQAKTRQNPEFEILTNMSKRQFCLCHWDYIFNCNENENFSGKIDHINKT